MKISLLPIIAGAMTVFAQDEDSPSPFFVLETGFQDYDSVLQTWSGSASTVAPVFSAAAILKATITETCNPPGGSAPPLQTLNTQAEWIEDAQDLQKTIANFTTITINRESMVEGSLGLAGLTIFENMLEGYRSSLPPCIDFLRTAFDNSQGQQGALDAIRGNVTALLNEAINAYQV